MNKLNDDYGLRGPQINKGFCPNDRELALRAKLQTGWSIKTNQFSQYPKPQPLSEREQQIIVSVVKKAEELDLVEQKRVGKLVDRLESLKKLANGNGVSECVLCGDTFGLYVFGRSNYKCHDCQKAVCRKCVVELSALKAGIIPVSSSPTSSGKDTMIRLCKVCSENRELIKKSGAWFYKGVPKYILPEKKNHYTNTYEKYASPRYQEQKYVSRYIGEEPSSSTNSGSSSSGVGTGASSSAATESSVSTSSTAVTTTSGTTSSCSGSASGNGNSSSKPGGFFWSRNLQNRSASAQLMVDPDNESSSGDEGAAGGSSHHLLRSSAVAAASVAGGPAVGVAATRHSIKIFSSKNSSSSLTGGGTTTSIHSTSTTTSSSSNHNGGGGNGSSGAGWSGMSLSRGHSPPVSRFMLHRNTPASSSLRSNASSSVPPGTPIPTSATSASEFEQFSASSGQVTPGPSGMASEHSHASSSLDLSPSSSSFRKKSYEKIDFSRDAIAVITSSADHHHHQQQAGAAGGSASNTTNNGDNNKKSSGSSSTDCLYQPSGSSSTSTITSTTTQRHRNSTTPSQSATSSIGSATASSSNSQQQEPSTASSPLGTIQVALLYDDSHQALHCSVLHAKGLAPSDANGLSDPYCILKLIPSRFEGTHLRTKTIHKTVNPIFNETLTFYGVTPHDLSWQTLELKIIDDDRWGKDCLGTTQIPLHRLRSQQTRCFVQSLERGRLSEEREWGRGRLLLSLTYMTEKSLLLVGVIQAQDLPALDHNGTSDPFVKVRLLHDTNLGALSTSCFSSSSINRKFRTSVKWRTLNPEFREEFSLKVSIVDLPRLALVISVWDKDLGKNDDYIGGIVLSTGSKGERLKHWMDMMKLPNTKHFKWHTLSPSELPSH